MLADVGVTRQGEVNPSAAVLSGVASAQCSPLETRHLFMLAGNAAGEYAGHGLRGVSPGRRMLDLMPQPASIQKPNFDIVAWNDSFCRLMGVDFATIAEEDRNCIYLYLTCETGVAALKIAMCCRLCFLFSRGDG